MTNTYIKNKILQLNASVILLPDITVSIYEWTINKSIDPNNQSSISLNTNNLSLGDNTISLRVLNSCGSWSEPVTKIINIIPEVKVIYTKNRNLTLNVTDANPGSPNGTIVKYEWKINDIIQSNNTDTLNVNTNNLNIGTNIMSLSIQNSCGAWSPIISKAIEVYPSVYKTFNINIDNQTVNKNVII